MAWNGSGVDGAPAPKVEAKKSPAIGKGLFAGALVVVLAALTAYFIFSPDKGVVPEEPKNRTKAIKEVKTTREIPVATRDTLKKMVKDKTGSDIVVAPYGYYTNKQGQVVARTRPKFVIGGKSNRPKIFASPAEDQLDGLVNTPLGSNYYDDRLPDNFEDEFAYSLTNNIVVLETDTPEIADRKQRVIEAKQFLLQAQKEGRNIREVVMEAKREMVQKFEDFAYIEGGLNKLKASNASPEEIAEYALAAKKLLERNGIEEQLHLAPDDRKAMKELENYINGVSTTTVEEGEEDDE